MITEAHACHTPCVVTETDGSLAQLENWPYLVAQNEDEIFTLEQLKKHVIELLNMDSTEYGVVQNEAYQKSDGFSLSYVCSEIEKEYSKLYLHSKLGVEYV